MTAYNIKAEAYTKRGRVIGTVGAKATHETEYAQRERLARDLFQCHDTAFKIVTCRGEGFDIRAHYRQNTGAN